MKNNVLKKMVAIFLALSIVMCLSACSGKDDGKQKEDEVQKDGEVQNTLVQEGGNVISDEKVSIDKNCKVGDYITFGTYEQDNNTSNGKEDIEWLVLDKQDDKILVISKYALDCQPYHEDYVDVTWENCTLRSWLNSEFINAAFTPSQKSIIPTATVTAEDNLEFNIEAGNDTQDRVFLLSINEACNYFSSEATRECKPTTYAEAQGAGAVKAFGCYGNCFWWLRSPGYFQDDAASVCTGGGFVSNTGLVHIDGYGVTVDFLAVRPAMWINL